MSENIVSQNHLTELGHKIPVLLIKVIEAKLLENTTNWLKDNHAPEEIIRAVDLIGMLNVYIQAVSAGNLSEIESENLPVDLTEAAALSIKFGGYFFEWDAGESTIPVWKKGE